MRYVLDVPNKWKPPLEKCHKANIMIFRKRCTIMLIMSEKEPGEFDESAPCRGQR